MLFMTDHQQQLAGFSVGMNFSPSQAGGSSTGRQGHQVYASGDQLTPHVCIDCSRGGCKALRPVLARLIDHNMLGHLETGRLTLFYLLHAALCMTATPFLFFVRFSVRIVFRTDDYIFSISLLGQLGKRSP